METAILEARQIVKRFGPVAALKGVSLSLHAGEIHALCGENGAGKSTLIKTLSGFYPADSFEGQILIDDKPVELTSVKSGQLAGISAIYQELPLVESMTVAENIFLGQEPTRAGRIDWLQVQSEARKLLRQFHIALDPQSKISTLGVGQKQLVEIVKALSRNARVLILDEPTAALSEAEIAVLLNIVRGLKQRGIGCIYISHKLDEVLAIADRITVLRDGESICCVNAKETSKPVLIRQMVGREITQLFPRRHASAPGAVKLIVKQLSVADSDGQTYLHDISFEARAGEVLGIGGLMGAGRSELLMHIFGAGGRRTGGQVLLDGKSLHRNTPGESLARGLALVTEDRKRYGLVLDQSIGFNLSLSSLNRLQQRGLLNQADEVQRNRDMAKSLRIKARGLETIVGRLSGGNQQKVVIGKALLSDPDVIFLDEPTRGIDVGAKLEVYELINRLCEAHKAVVLVSSELPELMGMSDRILMLSEGHVGGIFDRANATSDDLLAAAISRHHVATV